MTDPKDDVETEVKIEMTDDKGKKVELTEGDIEQMLNDAITVVEIPLSAGEGRQLRQFAPNNYHLTFKTSVEGVQKIIDMVGDDDKKSVKKLFLGLMMAKLAGQAATMKRFIHAQQVQDGFDPDIIDWRKGEKSKIVGE